MALRYPGRHQDRLRAAASGYAAAGWPVAPAHHTGGAGSRVSRRRRQAPPACSCGEPDCPTPGAHPLRPDWYLDATSERAAVGRWWSGAEPWNVVLATGHAFDAWTVPTSVASRALEVLDGTGHTVGPVLVHPRGCWTFLTEPGFAAAPPLLPESPYVGAVVYHGAGDFVVAPPSLVGGWAVRWWRAPGRYPRIPRTAAVVGALAAAADPTGGEHRAGRSLHDRRSER